MVPSIHSPHVHSPKTLNDALSLCSRHTDATVFAGGTALSVLGVSNDRFLALPKLIISLQRIEELQRITRTERFLEIGSTVTLNNLLEIGRNVLPQAFITALNRIGNPAVRNLATIGGNIANPENRMTLYPLLNVMDARLELRSAGNARWVPIGRFLTSEGRPVFKTGEILTRIRLPFTQWNVQVFTGGDRGIAPARIPVTFCGLANIQKDLLSDFRFIFSYPPADLIRRRELEAELVGRRLPLGQREISVFMEDFRNLMKTRDDALSRFQKEQSAHLLNDFLSALQSE